MKQTPIPGRDLIHVETDDKVLATGTPPRRFLYCRARRYADRHAALPYDMNGIEVRTYHLRIEKVGFLTYEIVPYQNAVVPDARG